MSRRAFVDLLFALYLFAAAEIEVALSGLGLGAALLAALATLPFALRRRLPAAPFLAAGVLVPALELAFGPVWLEPANAPIFVLVATAWTLGAAPLPVALAAIGACIALSAGDDTGFMAVLAGLPWACARAVQAHRERAAELRALAAQLADERAMSERLAVARERERMAREVHDAIAHAVGGMELQAAGAEQVLAADPERARAALVAVQDTGREAIAELRGALGILRAVDPPPPPPPQPAPRQRRPWPAAGPLSLAALALAVAAYVATGASLAAALPVFAATYAASAYAGRRGAAAAAVLGVGLPPAIVLVTGEPGDALIPLVFMALPWLAGRAVAAQRRRAAELVTLTGRLRGERDARMRLASLGERARVARELHDSVAHGVSVMVLQAGAAVEVLDRDAPQPLEAVQAVQEVGRTVLGELRRLVGDSPPDADPHPGLAGVPALLAAARAAGLPVSLREEGEPEPLTPAVDAAAFRVIQEAVTNAIRHAGAAATTVTIRHGADGLHVEVADDGPAAGANGAGHGIAGMRERVAQHGGELRAGPRPGGRGFVVSAHLPAERVPA